MVEMHGWLSIYETYEDEDHIQTKKLQDIKSRIVDLINNYDCGIQLKYMNGFPYISTTLYCNHHTKQVDDIIATYINIAKVATGSYGKIYLLDDEDEQYYDDVQVYIFKRGKMQHAVDDVFSPRIPKLEDEMK